MRIDSSLKMAITQADPARDSRVWNDGQVNKHSHHAIIPTLKADFDLGVLTKAEREIYTMIRNRYIAQFYPDYEYEAAVMMVVSVVASYSKSQAKCRKCKVGKYFWGNVSEDKNADDGAGHELPLVAEGDAVDALAAKQNTKKTTPPPRFTESTLLDEMQTLSDFLKTVDDDQYQENPA